MLASLAMLSLLQIRNFAIIDALDVELDPGFTAISGETGAGKSILVDALGLLLGGRGEAGVIRGGAERAELTAEFTLETNSAAFDWLREAGLDDSDTCVLRRHIGSNGRSRGWINGTAVTLTQLQELGETLVEIHGQNEHIRLTQPGEQFRLLDGDPACAQSLAEVEKHFVKLREIQQAIAALEQESALAPGDVDLLNYQIQELESQALAPAAFAEIESQHRLLARGGDVVAALESALDHLEQEESGVTAQLRAALHTLRRHAALDPQIANAIKVLEETSILCEEARSSLQAAHADVDLSPQKLASLEKQLESLHDLGRKHRVEPEHLQDVLHQLRERVAGAATRHQREQDLRKALAEITSQYRAAALNLHRARESRAQTLSREVTSLLQVLGMEGGTFEMRLEYDANVTPSRRGDDRIEILVSANPGIPPGPLKKVASGGELSRISLAVKVAAAGGQFAPTQVFDEVDAGIGGATASSVGRLLRSVAGNGQALCVTHLAQVAVCADHQFTVTKLTGERETRLETRVLDSRQRVDEIARMLSGTLSKQSRAHASELLASETSAKMSEVSFS